MHHVPNNPFGGALLLCNSPFGRAYPSVMDTVTVFKVSLTGRTNNTRYKSHNSKIRYIIFPGVVLWYKCEFCRIFSRGLFIARCFIARCFVPLVFCVYVFCCWVFSRDVLKLSGLLCEDFRTFMRIYPQKTCLLKNFINQKIKVTNFPHVQYSLYSQENYFCCCFKSTELVTKKGCVRDLMESYIETHTHTHTNIQEH